MNIRCKKANKFFQLIYRSKYIFRASDTYEVATSVEKPLFKALVGRFIETEGYDESPFEVPLLFCIIQEMAFFTEVAFLLPTEIKPIVEIAVE